jgi:hypothetical protein
MASNGCALPLLLARTIKDRDVSAGSACLGDVFGTLVLLGLLDQEDVNRQCISMPIKQDCDVEFPLEILTRRDILAEKNSISEGNIKAVCTEMVCSSSLFCVQVWIL